MSNPFFDHPILNSPYELPSRHWELDEAGQPTQKIIEARRGAKFITPIPKPKKRKASDRKRDLSSTKAKGSPRKNSSTTPPRSSTKSAAMWTHGVLCQIPAQWQVTPETARLLQHWRHHKFSGVRPFFCQVEAVETAIWLTEVAPAFAKREAPARPSRRREQGRQPGTDAARAETGHRRRQDHRDGDADRLADDQRGAPSGQQDISRAAFWSAHPA